MADEESTRGSICATKVCLPDDLLKSMPSAEELDRILAVLGGHSKPETEEERIFAPKDDSNYEAKIHDELLDARFIFGAYEVQKCVGRIESYDSGTGFRISKSLIMTAAHVFASSKEGSIVFHHYEPCLPDHPGNISPDAQRFELDPGTFYHENKSLDYAIIAIKSKRPGDLNDVGIVSCFCREIIPGAHTNVFSYPGGNTMKVSLRKNIALSKGERPSMVTVSEGLACKSSMCSMPPHILIHEADTEGGSSGAPVFNDQWQLVAVHRAYASQKIGNQCFQGNIASLIKYILEDMYSAPSQPGLSDFERKLWGKTQELGIPFEEAEYGDKLAYAKPKHWQHK